MITCDSVTRYGKLCVVHVIDAQEADIEKDLADIIELAWAEAEGLDVAAAAGPSAAPSDQQLRTALGARTPGFRGGDVSSVCSCKSCSNHIVFIITVNIISEPSGGAV